MVTFLNKESLTTKLTLIIVGLTAGSGLLIPATYASFHPVTTGEIADNTIQSRDISNTAGVASVDIINGQVSSADIRDRTITSGDVAIGSLSIPGTWAESEVVTIQAGQTGEAIATCPSGGLMTGGGFFVDTNNVQVYASQPNNGFSWFAAAANNDAVDTAQLKAYVVCIFSAPAN
jgi:hypothetical protein